MRETPKRILKNKVSFTLKERKLLEGIRPIKTLEKSYFDPVDGIVKTIRIRERHER